MTNEIIKTIEIEIGGVTVKVTPVEAKALFDALGSLLNQPTTKIIEREVYPRPSPFTQPYWSIQPPSHIFCSTSSTTDKYSVSCTTSGDAKLTIQ